MRITYSQLKDVFSDYELSLDRDAAVGKEAFASVELFTGQQCSDDVLYIVGESALNRPDRGALLVALEEGEPPADANCVIGLSAQGAFNVIAGYLMRLSRCLDDMRECLYQKRDLQGFCQALAGFARNPVIIYDASLLPAAQTEFPQEFALSYFGGRTADRDFVLRTVPDWRRQEGEDVFARTEARRLTDSEQRVWTAACNVIANGEFQGFIEIFEIHKPITDGEMVVLEEAARIAATAPLPISESGVVLSHLEGHPIQGDLTASWLSALRWREDDGVYVIAIEPPVAQRDDKLYLDHVIRMTRLVVPYSVSQQMGEMPVVVANDRLAKREKAVSDIASFLTKIGRGAHVGASEVMNGIASLHEGYAHAHFAAQFARSAGSSGAVLFEECRFAFFCKLCNIDENAGLIIDPRVARMWADDAESGSENVRTVKSYIETGFNLSATAIALSVHRNTVAYRLKHIVSTYGIDLASPIADSGLVFEVLLSCKIICDA